MRAEVVAVPFVAHCVPGARNAAWHDNSRSHVFAERVKRLGDSMEKRSLKASEPVKGGVRAPTLVAQLLLHPCALLSTHGLKLLFHHSRQLKGRVFDAARGPGLQADPVSLAKEPGRERREQALL